MRKAVERVLGTILLILIFLASGNGILLFGAEVASPDFFVSPNGDDRSLGTREKPFSTLTRARGPGFKPTTKAKTWRNAEADRNVYWNTADPEWGKRHLKAEQGHGSEPNSIATDPLFVDPANGIEYVYEYEKEENGKC